MSPLFLSPSFCPSPSVPHSAPFSLPLPLFFSPSPLFLPPSLWVLREKATCSPGGHLLAREKAGTGRRTVSTLVLHFPIFRKLGENTFSLLKPPSLWLLHAVSQSPGQEQGPFVPCPPPRHTHRLLWCANAVVSSRQTACRLQPLPLMTLIYLQPNQ